MLQAVFGVGAGTGAGPSCDLWSVPLAAPASLVQVSPAGLSFRKLPANGGLFAPTGPRSSTYRSGANQRIGWDQGSTK